jgi:hypothetical protein
MKQVFVLAPLLFTGAAFAADCPDLSGRYGYERIESNPISGDRVERYVNEIVQEGCERITIKDKALSSGRSMELSFLLNGLRNPDPQSPGRSYSARFDERGILEISYYAGDAGPATARALHFRDTDGRSIVSALIGMPMPVVHMKPLAN